MTDDPFWSPDVRARVQGALDGVLVDARDVLMRYSRDGVFVLPGDMAQFGDVTGLINLGQTQVLDRLEASIAQARRVIDEVNGELSAHLGSLGEAGPTDESPRS